MNIANKVKLIWSYFKGDISAHNKKVLDMAISDTASKSYQLDMGAVLVTNKRRYSDEPLRAVIRGHSGIDNGLGIACTINGASRFQELGDQQCYFVCKFINEFNMVQKGKYAGSDKEVRRNSHLRPRQQRTDRGDSSSNQG